MKTKSVLFVVLIGAALIACKNDKKNALTALDIATSKIQLSIDTLNSVLASAAVSMTAIAEDPAALRAKLQKIRLSSMLTKEVAFITPQGNMQIIEPRTYREFEGANRSSDPLMKSALMAKQPVLSGLFKSAEGYDAVLDFHPVLNGTDVIGAIGSMFTPYDLIHRIRITLVSAPDEIWVMDKEGTVLYKQDPNTIGKNVFTDGAFSKFDNFKSACQTIAGAESGEVTYSYYATGSTTMVGKTAFWKTIKMPENSWKVVYAMEN